MTLRAEAKSLMRDRILRTADRLFYAEGIQAVGVDTIAAEVGNSNRTQYNHFVPRPADPRLPRRIGPAGPRIRPAAGGADPGEFDRSTFFAQPATAVPLHQCEAEAAETPKR